MLDYIRRFLIVFIMGVCISLLFLGGKQAHAEGTDHIDSTQGVTEHWIWPTDGIVSDLFGTRAGNHRGIDIAGELKAPIYSVDSGVVEKSYYSDTYGHVIFVKHQNGYETVYAHLAERFADEGELVEQGEIIGSMGSTGISSGVHLHFEVHRKEWTYEKENAVDPMIAIGQVALGESVTAARNNDIVTVMNYVPSTDITRIETVNNEIETYNVEEKDTLWGIAEENDTTVQQLMEDNNLNSDIIYPDQQIKIRKQKEYQDYKGILIHSIER